MNRLFSEVSDMQSAGGAESLQPSACAEVHPCAPMMEDSGRKIRAFASFPVVSTLVLQRSWLQHVLKVWRSVQHAGYLPINHLILLSLRGHRKSMYFSVSASLGATQLVSILRELFLSLVTCHGGISSGRIHRLFLVLPM